MADWCGGRVQSYSPRVGTNFAMRRQGAAETGDVERASKKGRIMITMAMVVAADLAYGLAYYKLAF